MKKKFGDAKQDQINLNLNYVRQAMIFEDKHNSYRKKHIFRSSISDFNLLKITIALSSKAKKKKN